MESYVFLKIKGLLYRGVNFRKPACYQDTGVVTLGKKNVAFDHFFNSGKKDPSTDKTKRA